MHDKLDELYQTIGLPADVITRIWAASRPKLQRVSLAASGPLVSRIRKSKIAGAFLDGVNVGSLALMAEVSWQLGRTSVVDVVTIVLAVASLIALLQFRLNSGWLVLIGAMIGLMISAFHIQL